MSDGGYRDALTGLRARVWELRAGAEALERRIGWSLWASTEFVVRSRLEELRSAVARAPTDDAASLHALEGALQESIALLRQVLETADAVAASLDADCAGDPQPGPFFRDGVPPSTLQLDDVGLLAAIAPLRTRILAADPGCATAMGNDGVMRVRFRARDVELGLSLLMMLDPLYRSNVVCFAMGVRVPSVVPTFTVATAGPLTGIGSALGLVVDRQTGDDAFDSVFRVGMPAYAVALLTSDVRRALLGLRPLKHLELQARSGLARLQWSSEVTDATLEGPLEVMLGLRAAALELQR